MIKRVRREDIPAEKLKQLEPLRQDIVDYVLIGENYYEIRPFAITKIMTIFNEIVALVNEYNNSSPDGNPLVDGITANGGGISIQNVLADPNFKEKFVSIVSDMLSGVDKVDIESMNVAQFNEVLNKIWEVNIRSFPDEKTKTEFMTKVVGIMMIINPDLYRYMLNSRFIDDLNKVLERRSDLREEIDKELRKMYSENVVESKENLN